MDKDYLKDISEIRNMMERSSRFISLSGLSGILAGTYALIGAFVASKLIYTSDVLVYDQIRLRHIEGNSVYLFLVAFSVFVLAVVTGIILTVRKAKKNGQKTWDRTTQRLLINLFIPIAAGGFVIIMLYQRDLIGLIAPLTLVFYGLGLINASHYTYRDIRYLGISEVVLGLVALNFIGLGLQIWAIGFGVLHIVYGGLMYYKYER